MAPALLIRLRPAGPWRYGPGDGGADATDALYRSDRLFSAVTLAMQRLGSLEEWLSATAHAPKPAVVLSSLFPYQGDTLFAPPPSNVWPPPSSLVTTPSPGYLSKRRWAAARFVPLSVIESILTGQAILADQWMPDAESGCLLRRDRPSLTPFRKMVRGSAAVDRTAQSAVHVHSLACVEFEPDSGLWCLARYSDAAAELAWAERVKACFRLLADSGFGGRRSSGWGHAEAPKFEQGAWPNLLFPKLARLPRNGNRNGNGEEAPLYWLLSLYSPAITDTVNWSGGDYRLDIRGGRVDSAARPGVRKKAVRMIVEGSVLATRDEPVGAAVDVAPDGFPHAVYRSGFAVALQLPAAGPPDTAPVEIPPDEEALESAPCEERAVASIVEESSAIEQAPGESANLPAESEAVSDEL